MWQKLSNIIYLLNTLVDKALGVGLEHLLK